MEDLTLRLESRPFGRTAFPQVSHIALDVAARRPQPLGKRRTFSTATSASMTTNPVLRLKPKGGAETRLVTAQCGHFINTGSLSAPNTKCPHNFGIGVRFRRYQHHSHCLSDHRLHLSVPLLLRMVRIDRLHRFDPPLCRHRCRNHSFPSCRRQCHRSRCRGRHRIFQTAHSLRCGLSSNWGQTLIFDFNLRNFVFKLLF